MSWYREVYLKSEKWDSLRLETLVRQSREGKCLLCLEEFNSLDIHHLEYKNLYDVTPDHLRAVCRSCHNKIHELYEKYPELKKMPSQKQWIVICNHLAKYTKHNIDPTLAPHEKIQLVGLSLFSKLANGKIPEWSNLDVFREAVEDKLRRKKRNIRNIQLNERVLAIEKDFKTILQMISRWANQTIRSLPIIDSLPSTIADIERKLEKRGGDPAPWMATAIENIVKAHGEELRLEPRVQRLVDICGKYAIR